MPPARIILVRHGEARAGIEHVIGGDEGCLGLTERGREQDPGISDGMHYDDLDGHGAPSGGVS